MLTKDNIFSFMTLEADIGRRIVLMRRKQKLTQEDLAGMAILDRSYLSEIENGRRKISVDVLKKLSEALGVNMSELLGE